MKPPSNYTNHLRQKTAYVARSVRIGFETFKLWLPNGQASTTGRDRRPVRCTAGLGGKCFLLSFRYTFIVLGSAYHNLLHCLFAISLCKFAKPSVNCLLSDLTQFFNDYFFKGVE